MDKGNGKEAIVFFNRNLYPDAAYFSDDGMDDDFAANFNNTNAHSGSRRLSDWRQSDFQVSNSSISDGNSTNSSVSGPLPIGYSYIVGEILSCMSHHVISPHIISFPLAFSTPQDMSTTKLNCSRW